MVLRPVTPLLPDHLSVHPLASFSCTRGSPDLGQKSHARKAPVRVSFQNLLHVARGGCGIVVSVSHLSELSGVVGMTIRSSRLAWAT